MSWPVANEPLELPIVVRAVENNLSIRFDRATAPYLKNAENKAVTSWLAHALSAPDAVR
jgi:hypothetical protein